MVVSVFSAKNRQTSCIRNVALNDLAPKWGSHFGTEGIRHPLALLRVPHISRCFFTIYKKTRCFYDFLRSN
jgi:hypothetical protein